MRVAFVTGASGFIGSHLVERLIHEGWAVRALVHKKDVPPKKGLEIIPGDMDDIELMREAMKGTDAVFHLAAALGSSIIRRQEFSRINVLGTNVLLKAAVDAEIKRVVHFSSAGVLGKVDSNNPAGEDSLLNPQNVYDRTKLEGEKAAIRSLDAGLDVVVIRPGWVYGPGDRRTFKLIRAIAKKRFFLVTNGTARQTPVNVYDLITGVLLCYEKGIKGNVYHIAGGEVLTVKEMVMTIASAAGTSIPKFNLPLLPVKGLAWFLDRAFTLFNREAPLTPGKLVFFTHPKPLDIHKARTELDYSPGISFRKGMFDALAWYREQGWLD